MKHTSSITLGVLCALLCATAQPARAAGKGEQFQCSQVDGQRIDTLEGDAVLLDAELGVGGKTDTRTKREWTISCYFLPDRTFACDVLKAGIDASQWANCFALPLPVGEVDPDDLKEIAWPMMSEICQKCDPEKVRATVGSVGEQ